jgi:hypothetical protein
MRFWITGTVATSQPVWSVHRGAIWRVTSIRASSARPGGFLVFFLLRLLFLPIWLPLKLIKRAGRRRRHGSSRISRGGCLAIVLIVGAVALIGGIGAAVSGGGNRGGSRPTATVSSVPAVAGASRISSPTVTTAPAANPQPATGPGGCHPLSDEGTCYEPGEFCRDSDHGMTGLAGDGETIICENNDGWRWEPVSATAENNPPPAPPPPPAASPSPQPTPSPVDSPSPSPSPGP